MEDDNYGIPQVEEHNLGYKVSWEDGVEITMDMLNTRSDLNIEAEIQVKDYQELNPVLIPALRVAITGAMQTLLRGLEKAVPTRDWDGRIKQASYFVLQEYRRGEPIVKLNNMEAPEMPPERITGIAYEGMPTLIYGDGGMGKSTLAIALLTLVQAGKPLGDTFNVIQGNAMVLDWESSAEEAWRRSHAIVSAMGLGEEAMVYYRFCSAPLASEIETLRAEIKQKDISVILVDSAGPACGGEPEKASPTLQFFSALRRLSTTERPVTTITLAHVAKNSGGKLGPYGSPYWVNIPRNTFELKKSQIRGENFIDLALHHRKTNTGNLHRDPVGLRITWAPEGITIKSFNVADHAVLSEGLGYGERVYKLLSEHQVGMSAEDIADLLNISNKVTDLVSQLRQDSRFEVDDNGQWSLNASLNF